MFACLENDTGMEQTWSKVDFFNVFYRTNFAYQLENDPTTCLLIASEPWLGGERLNHFEIPLIF